MSRTSPPKRRARMLLRLWPDPWRAPALCAATDAEDGDTPAAAANRCATQGCQVRWETSARLPPELTLQLVEEACDGREWLPVFPPAARPDALERCRRAAAACQGRHGQQPPPRLVRGVLRRDCALPAQPLAGGRTCAVAECARVVALSWRRREVGQRSCFSAENGGDRHEPHRPRLLRARRRRRGGHAQVHTQRSQHHETMA
eukprot:scaffold549_cov385-Prasinococcus_capsulatus_cf.AAC.22